MSYDLSPVKIGKSAHTPCALSKHKRQQCRRTLSKKLAHYIISDRFLCFLLLLLFFRGIRGRFIVRVLCLIKNQQKHKQEKEIKKV